mmetsp:Transcript_46777/g.148410  ORF Transcript_46777/g.148410 Transcript_46777/m.148410 type:complete len:219 (-) Transcript_46777:380-1036(-)
MTTCRSGSPRLAACASIKHSGCARKTAPSGRKTTSAATRSDASRHAASSARLQSLPPVQDTAQHSACGPTAWSSRRLGPAQGVGVASAITSSTDLSERTSPSPSVRRCSYPYAASAWREPREPSRKRLRARHSGWGGTGTPARPPSGGAATCLPSTISSPSRRQWSSTRQEARWLPHSVRCIRPPGASSDLAEARKWPIRAVCRRACSSTLRRSERPR